MAAIDKIYGTYYQAVEFWEWMKQHKPEYCKYMTEPELYRHFPDNKERNISCFPESVDKWLLKHCTIPWVVDRINEQYGLTKQHQKEPTVKVRRGQ